MKAVLSIVWLIIILVIVSIVFCGCEEKVEDDSHIPGDLLLLATCDRIGLACMNNTSEIEERLEELREIIDAARDVNGINLNLLKRVSEMEVDYNLFGSKWYDNQVRIENLESDRDPNLLAYDPNHAIYKFIPAADVTWTERFGDNHKTRIVHSLSEARVIVSNIGKRLTEIEEWIDKIEKVWNGEDLQELLDVKEPVEPNEANP